MRDAHHCSGPPVSEMTYTVSNGTLNSTISYHNYHIISSPFSALSRRGLNPIKPVYDQHRPEGRLDITASAFNQLGQYTSSPGRRGAATQNSPFSFLTVAVTIASTHRACPRRDGQAELAWVAGYVYLPKGSHPSQY